MNDNERISELEARVAFQEDTIDKLNEAVSRQEIEIGQLTRMVKIINQQLKSFKLDSADYVPEDEPPPPHY